MDDPQPPLTPGELVAEQWKPVPSWPEYEVSDMGRMRRVKPYQTTLVGKILKTYSCNGYPAVCLRSHPRKAHGIIHQLVAVVFIGPRPEGMQINHRDGVKTNNRATNLEYVSASENSRHSVRSGLSATGDRHPWRQNPSLVLTGDRHISRTHPERMQRGDAHWSRRRPEKVKRGAANNQAKLTEAAVREIRALFEAGAPGADIARKFGISEATASKVKLRRSWQHVA